MKIVVSSPSGLLKIVGHIFMSLICVARDTILLSKQLMDDLDIETRFHSLIDISINPNQSLDYIKQEILASIGKL